MIGTDAAILPLGILGMARWLAWRLILVCLVLGSSEAGAVEKVAFDGYPRGAIVVKTAERHLYYVIGKEQALRYPVAVGRAQRQWQGRTRVARKLRNPVWIPPPAVRKDKPNLPAKVPPGPSNPLGVAVLILGDGRYGIHGTNNPGSIGREASYGCIRMHNSHILELYAKVSVGTPVYVLK
jgi:lipoprotein-anchoring transpeptidase ErfK/SrfK